MKKKILIIDDDTNIRVNITTILSEEGYEVLCCSSGKAGIKLATEEIPDLIICDIMMEGIDGYSVFQTLSQQIETNGIPFIFLSAKVEINDFRTGMQLGADDYLFKPFDIDDLLNSIKTRLKRMQTIRKYDVQASMAEQKQQYTLDESIIVQTRKLAQIIKINEIAAINAARQYTELVLAGGKSCIVRKSITAWEKLLPSRVFFRVHRSAIININYVKKMEPWNNAGFIVHLENISEPIIISRRYVSKLKKILLK